ncbi:MAG: hypothetical protein E7450_05930 [Ruminococcaceae bacterium]|nr:hypothetical protein [Oscillospiraceae bacterium]
MVGKHIFVRCRNEQGNAGTWTAAVTEKIADKDTIRNHIEPRCNVDETFAQDTLMACPGNNILRIYYANQNTLVVSRSFWVTDRITETQGRKGAYSTSYILTGEDVARFCGDYSGAFDLNCFESYDDLVARIAAEGNNTITVNRTKDLFTHGMVGTDASVLTRCNFDKDSFIAFMNALYDAVENKKQVAVILPAALRAAWVERGDTTAEQLGHFILSLLPDFMRINCGMVSSWSCQINDKMVSDMQLLFVHPRSDEDIAYLKREGAHIIDLDGGRFTSEIKTVAADYFAFVWDNVADMDRLEEFWAYSKSNYRKLLRGRPTSARAMECIYLIRRMVEEGYADEEKCHRTLRLAAYEFAGAGTKVPAAESFLNEAINKLELTSKPLDDSTEAALRHLMSADGEKTKHQQQVYQLLLGAIEAGTAKAETVAALCAELRKGGRDADSYFLSYLSDKLNLTAEEITPQLSQLVCGIFAEVCCNQNSSTSANILQTIFGIVETWTDRLQQEASNWQAMVTPFVELYAAYIKDEERNAKGLKVAYLFLFRMCASAGAELREKCAKILMKEEVRIYRSGHTTLSDGSSRFATFASSFLERFPDMVRGDMDALGAAYERLFRIIFNPERGVSDAAISAYETITKQVLSADASDKMVQCILTGEERALKDKPPIWNEAHTEQALLRVEQVNLTLLSAYFPGEERLGVLVGNLNPTNHGIFPIFAEYINRSPFHARQYTYNILSRTNMLESLFVYVLFNCDFENVQDEMVTLLGLNHEQKINKVFSLNFFGGSAEETTRFTTWYRQELEQTLFTENAFTEQRHGLVMREWALLHSAQSFSAPLARIALEIYATALSRLYNLIGREAIASLPPEIIRDIENLRSQIMADGQLTHEDLFEFVWLADNTILNRSSVDLRLLCEQHMTSAESSRVLQKRLSMHLKEKRCPSALACEIYHTMLLTPPAGTFPMESLLSGLGYENMSNLERGVLLAKIILQVHNDRAMIEREIGRRAMNYLEHIAQEDGQTLLNEKFLVLWRQIRVIDYTRNTLFTRTMARVQRGQSLKFDLSMFLLCLIGLVVTVLFVGGMAALAVNVMPVLAVIILVVLLLGMAALAVWMMDSLLKSTKRR